ncbi:MAG: lysophospholipid acyltransferase family protein [Desulfosarcinaceae bacterium]
MRRADGEIKLIDKWVCRIVRAWFSAVGRLPATARERCATFLGRLLYALAGQRRRITLDNLRRAYGPAKSTADIESTARRVFENCSRMIFEIGWALRLREAEFPGHFKIRGASDYEKAMAKGRGALMLIAHFGNWELLPIVARMLRMPIHIVYRPMDLDGLDLFFRQNRTRFGGSTIPVRRGAMQKIYRALRAGCPVGMLMDQGADWYDGVFVDFFNRRAATNTGMAILALKTKAPVVPIFLIRRPRGFEAVFGPELPLISTGDYTKDLEANTQLYNKVIETYARKFTDQWFWIHHRWKNRPYCPWPRRTIRKGRKRRHIGLNTVEIT